jgi:hypothetical protein
VFDDDRLRLPEIARMRIALLLATFVGVLTTTHCLVERLVMQFVMQFRHVALLHRYSLLVQSGFVLLFRGKGWTKSSMSPSLSPVPNETMPELLLR